MSTQPPQPEPRLHRPGGWPGQPRARLSARPPATVRGHFWVQTPLDPPLEAALGALGVWQTWRSSTAAGVRLEAVVAPEQWARAVELLGEQGAPRHWVCQTDDLQRLLDRRKEARCAYMFRLGP